MTYDNTNSGALFKNEKKETEKHPDYTGTINVDGRELRLAAWIRESKNGRKFMSLKVSEQREAREKPAAVEDDFKSDDIPF